MPRGSGRNFELLVVLTEPGENCPALDASFLGKNENVYRTYVAGRAFNVNLDSDNATVDIILDFPGLMASMGEARNSVCQPQATLRGSLLSNGDIVTAGGITDSFLSSPINFSYYKTGLGDTRAVGVMATSGELNLFAGQSFTLPPYVLSVTRKPDSGMYIGMVADGSLVQIIPNGADSTAVPLNAASCPFFTSNCQVPPWMQSLSAGFGGRLYGLDHGGQVYEIGAQGPVFTGLTMPAVVSQVSFY